VTDLRTETSRPVGRRPDVEITVPALGQYVAVLRTAAAGVAAGADLTLDDIDDLRMAVDEACSVLLDQSIPGGELRCGFTLAPHEVRVEASVHSLHPVLPSRTGFAWMVLTSLSTSVDVAVHGDDEVTISLLHTASTGAPR